MGSILDSEEQEALLDICIKPELDHLGSFAFEEYEEFIELGYISAKENAEALKKIAKQQVLKTNRHSKLILRNINVKYRSCI
jgi:hypothetical protein